MFIEIFSSHLRNIAELRDVIIKGQCRLDIKKYSFSHRIINVWNILLTYCVNDSSVNMRTNLQIYHESGLHIDCCTLDKLMASLSICHLGLAIC